jgi:uncharacterized protein YggU (UPF0235/DUF167 family)
MKKSLELDLRIFVRVKPGAKVDKVEKVDEKDKNHLGTFLKEQDS